jgi:DNA-binding MarR family transcriptional regulator
MDSLTVVEDQELVRDVIQLREALLELMRVIQFRDRDRLCAYDVTVSQCYALKAVGDRGTLTVNELAAALYLDKSTASRLANSLEKKGYVRKRSSAADGRSVQLVLTEQGQLLAQRINDDLLREYRVLLQGFNPEVRSAVTQLVRRLTDAVAVRVQVSGGSCCSVA